MIEDLCEEICEVWYQQCKEEQIDPYVNVQENLPFCKEESLLCSSVADTFQNSAEFCKAMGYKVRKQQIENEHEFLNIAENDEY